MIFRTWDCELTVFKLGRRKPALATQIAKHQHQFSISVWPGLLGDHTFYLAETTGAYYLKFYKENKVLLAIHAIMLFMHDDM
jgi:hypothetical protein